MMMLMMKSQSLLLWERGSAGCLAGQKSLEGRVRFDEGELPEPDVGTEYPDLRRLRRPPTWQNPAMPGNEMKSDAERSRSRTPGRRGGTWLQDLVASVALDFAIWGSSGGTLGANPLQIQLSRLT